MNITITARNQKVKIEDEDINDDIVSIVQDLQRLVIALKSYQIDLSTDIAGGTIPVSAVPAHATTHEAGGTDSIALDTLAVPTDITTLNASTSKHGLMPKGDGTATHVYRGNLTQSQLASTELSDTSTIGYLAGANTWTGSNDFTKQLFFGGVISPAALSTGNNNNYAPTGFSTCNVLKVTGDGGSGSTLTGLAGGADQRIVLLVNVGTDTITLTQEDGNSSAGSRFKNAGSLITGKVALLNYDGVTNRWATSL